MIKVKYPCQHRSSCLILGTNSPKCEGHRSNLKFRGTLTISPASLFFRFGYLIVYTVTVVPIFPLVFLPPVHPPFLQSIPTPLYKLIGHAYMFFTNPSTFFHPVPTSSITPYSCQSVLCFYNSDPILLVSLFCSLDSTYK